MAELTIPNPIVADEPALAGPVQANFDAIESFANNQVIHADGSKAFTALPTAPSDALPTSAGHLVTKAALDGRTGVVAKRIKNDGSAYAYGPSWVDMGVSLGSFSWPTITAPASFTVSVNIPEFLVGQYDGGQWPIEGITLDVGLFLGTQLLQIGKVVTTRLNALVPDATASLHFERTWFDNSWRAAGTPTTLSLKGRIIVGGGSFKLQGTANAPIEVIGRLH